MPDPYPGNLTARHGKKAKSKPPRYRYKAWPAWLERAVGDKVEKKVFESLDKVPRGEGWTRDGVLVHEGEPGLPPRLAADTQRPAKIGAVDTGDEMPPPAAGDTVSRAEYENVRRLLAQARRVAEDSADEAKRTGEELMRVAAEAEELRGQLADLSTRFQQGRPMTDEPPAEIDLPSPLAEQWMGLDLDGLRQRATASGMDVNPKWNLHTLRIKYKAWLEGGEVSGTDEA